MRAGRIIGAAQAPFALAGTHTTLAVLRHLAASTGAFSVSGNDTQLVYSPVVLGKVLISLSGLLSLNGGAASMRVTRHLRVGAGTFSSSPGEAAIRFGGRLGADTNVFHLEGSDAGLRASWRLVAAALTFTVSGHSLIFRLMGIDLPDSRIYRGPPERRIVRANPERRLLRFNPERRVYRGHN